MSSSSVLLVTHDVMERHASPAHPERPARLAAVAAGVRDAAGENLVERPAPFVDARLAASVHARSYLEVLERADRDGGGWLDADTYVVAGSLAAARAAAGGAVDVALAVARGDAGVGFAVVRPPGHHASREVGSGFCLMNNVAMAVAALRRDGAARRMAIVDWDVHHGDGTQAIFDADADVWYGSTHQAPLYPGTGYPADTGIGAAAGTKYNRPLRPGTGDDEFVAAWTGELIPSLEAYRPEAVLVSAGYDAHRSDPLADLVVTEDGYESVGEALGEATRRLGLPGVSLTLEGGYDLEALRASAAATVRGLVRGRSGVGS